MSRLLYLLPLFSLGLILSSPASAEQNLTHLTVNQWVHPVTEGTLVGRVIIPSGNGQVEAIADASVAILGRDGEVIRSKAKTNAKGAFLLEGVEPGVYALTARAENIFACCALHVLDEATAAGQKFPSEAEIAAANVDFTMVNMAMIRYLPPKVAQSDVSLANANVGTLTNLVCGQDMYRVVQTDGGMLGQLHLAGAQGDQLGNAKLTNVFVIQDGMEVGRAVTDETGSFKIDRLEPGQYSLMAIGTDGLGLIGFELVDPTVAAQAARAATSGDETLVARLGGCCCRRFAMQVAPMPEIIHCVEEVVVTETPVETACGGCGESIAACGCGTPVDPCAAGGVGVDGVMFDEFGNPIPGSGFMPAGGGFAGGGFAGGGGFGGGGGGFGGGFGGLGGLAGLAGVAGIIAATTSDDNPVIIPVPPTQTPAFPN